MSNKYNWLHAFSSPQAVLPFSPTIRLPEYSYFADQGGYPYSRRGNKCNQYVMEELQRRGFDVPQIPAEEPNLKRKVFDALTLARRPRENRFLVTSEFRTPTEARDRTFIPVNEEDLQDGDVVTYITGNNAPHMGLAQGDKLRSANWLYGVRDVDLNKEINREGAEPKYFRPIKSRGQTRSIKQRQVLRKKVNQILSKEQK